MDQKRFKQIKHVEEKHRCVGCQGPLQAVIFLPGAQVHGYTKKMLGLSTYMSDVQQFMCADCGMLTAFALDPEALRRDADLQRNI